MGKMVGFTRMLKQPWLDKAMSLAKEGFDDAQMRDELEHYLSFEIDSDTNRRKTREILIAVWGSKNESTQEIRAYALGLNPKNEKQRMAVHWGMLMVAFPVFTDVVRLIGKIGEYQDEFAPGQVKQKILDEWGERTTLVKGSEKIIASLNQFGVIERVRVGLYRIADSIDVNSELSNFLLHAELIATCASYKTFEELLDMPALFPFKVSVDRETLMESGLFAANTYGSTLVYSSSSSS